MDLLLQRVQVHIASLHAARAQIFDSDVGLFAQNGYVKEDAPFAISSNWNGRGPISAGCLFDLMSVVFKVHAFNVVLSERMVLSTSALT